MDNQLNGPEQATLITRKRSGRLWMAFILGALGAFGPLSMDMYLPALPEVANDMNTSTSLAQMSLTACLLGLAIGQIIAGPLSDIRGRRTPLLGGLVIYIVSSLLCALSPTISVFVVVRFIQGMAGSAGIVIGRAIVRDLYSGTELTKFFSLLMLVNGVAPIFAPIAGGQLLKVTSWSGVFIFLSLFGVLMFLAVFFGLPETLTGERRSRGGIKNIAGTFGQLIRQRIFMGYALSQGFVLAGMFAYISGSPFVLQKIFGLSPQMFSLVFALNGLGIIIATQTTGRLAGRIREEKLLSVGLGMAFLASISLLVMIMTGAGLFGILPPLFIVVSSVGIVTTAAFSLAMQNQGKAAGSASSLLGVLSMIIGALVAPLVGIGGSQTAVPMGIVIAAMGTGAVFSYLVLIREGRQVQKVKN
ncbi:MAG: multidrug effflux MFS transporter [Peptococcaceae bacterium]